MDKIQPFFLKEHHRSHHGHHPHNHEFSEHGRHRRNEEGHHGRGGRRGHGRHGLHSGRKLSSADLQLILMAQLAQQPAHGYELIQSLDDHSHGLYVPSPGMIYPALTYLEEIGFASVEMEGTKKRYSLTEEGKAHYKSNRESAHRILDEMEKIGSQLSAPNNSDRPAQPDTASIVFEAIRNRRSMGLSRLKSDPIDRHLIEQMLEAANWAPSHGDTEPWRFTVFSGGGREALAAYFDAAHGGEQRDPQQTGPSEGARKRAFAAPVWISIGMSPALKEDGSLLMSEEEEIIAVACAVQNLHIMAGTLGLAGMWHSKGSSVAPEVAQALGLEPPARLLGFFMCGWPATELLTSSRKPISEKVTWIENP